MKQFILIVVCVIFIFSIDAIAQGGMLNDTQRSQAYQESISNAKLKVREFKQALRSKDTIQIKKAVLNIQLDPAAIKQLNKENIFVKKKWNDYKNKEVENNEPDRLSEEKYLPFSEVVSFLTYFREDGAKDSQAAFVKYADTKTAAKLRTLGNVLSPASDPLRSWQFFFGSSVAAVASLSEYITLAMFYNPWADVALLCEWTRVNGKPKITQVKLICGDEIRNTEIPVLLPLWRRSGNIPAPLSLSVASSDTVHAFINLYGKRPKWPAKQWADKLPSLRTDNPKEDSKKIVGLFFSQNLSSINTVFNNATYSKLKVSMEEIQQQLISGKGKDLLIRTPETINESRAVLAALTPEDWIPMTIVSFSADSTNAFILFSSSHAPQSIASFWFTMDNDNHVTLHRIDFFKLDLSFKEADKLARKAGIKRPKTIDADHKNGGCL